MSCLICYNKRRAAIAEQLFERKAKRLCYSSDMQSKINSEVYFSCTSTLRFLKRYARRFLMFARCLYAKNLNPPQRRQQLGSFCQHKNTRCKNLQFVLLQQDYVGHCLAGSGNFQIFLGNGGRFYCFQMWLGLL